MVDIADSQVAQQVMSALNKDLAMAEKLAASAGIAVKDLYKTFGTAATSVINMSNSVQQASTGLLNMNSIMDYFKKEIREIGENKEFQNNLINIGSAALASGTNLYNLSETFKSFDAHITSADASTKGFATQISEFLPKSLQGITKLIPGFIEAVSKVNAFENEMLTAAMAGGNFYNMIEKNSKSLSENLTGITAKISMDAKASAAILGISYNDALQRIQTTASELPGEFDKVYTVTDDLNMNTKNVYSSMELLSQVARGTGQSFQTAFGISKDLIERFSEKADIGAGRVARLAQASKDTGIGMKMLTDLSGVINESFKMWGDEMNSTINVLGKVSEALNGTTVGIRGQVEIVKALENNLGLLALPMKSFIALSAGMRGPGGMVGAGLQVEKMLQEGKIGDVVQMMQDALTKRTGTNKVMTLAEATEQPGREREFLIQRQLLSQMSGQSDTGMLNRMMEAMSKTQLGGSGGSMKDQASAQDEMAKALGAGKDLTESQTNRQLQQIEIERESAGFLAAITAKLYSKEYMGYGSGEIDNLLAANQKLPSERTTSGDFGVDQIKSLNAQTQRDALDKVKSGAEAIITKLDDKVGGQFTKLMGNDAHEKRIGEIKELHSRAQALNPEEKKKLKNLETEEMKYNMSKVPEGAGLRPFTISEAELARGRSMPRGADTSMQSFKVEPIEVILRIYDTAGKEHLEVLSALAVNDDRNSNSTGAA